MENTWKGRAHHGDWRGVGNLVAFVTEQVTLPVEGMHRAIVGRWLGIAGTRAMPARQVADGLTSALYSTIRVGATAVGAAISIGAELAGPQATLPPAWESPRGRHVQSVLNAVWGDRLDKDESPLRTDLGFRDQEGCLVPVTPLSLSRSFPSPKARLAVLVHGLGETERCWAAADDPNWFDGLEARGFSVLPLRYNTGRAVADNGSDLADLLEQLCTAWPVSVQEIVLIGHSMGGLVARSAVSAGLIPHRPWVELTSHLVAIATPHLGSPIEKALCAVSGGLSLVGESRPLSEFLDRRSAGIKGLRKGIDDDVMSTDTIEYHVVAGAVTRDPAHPIGALLGDLVVRTGSAIGRGRQSSIEPTDIMVAGGLRHGGLLRDSDVVSQTLRWLART